MALPVGAILALFDLASNDRVHKGMSALWGRLPFGRDAKLAARVEARAQELATELSALSRTLGAADLDAEIGRRFARFERDIVADGVAADAAPGVRAEVERTVLASAVEPVRELIGLQTRIQELEERASAADARASDAAKAIRRAAVLSATAFAIGGSGFLLALLAVLRG